jgi:hypothetical protein
MNADGSDQINLTHHEASDVCPSWRPINIVEVDETHLEGNAERSYELIQNYPNPFNPNTMVRYSIPQRNFVSLKVYDLLGNDIVTLVNEKKSAGSYEVEFSATGLPSGIYLYQLQTNSSTETKKMLYLK